MAQAAIIAHKRRRSQEARPGFSMAVPPDTAYDLANEARDSPVPQAVVVNVDPATAAVKLQRAVRGNLFYKNRLHRANLAERLKFETHVGVGALRLFNQIVTFTMLLLSLRFSSDGAVKLGIYHDLDKNFDFSALRDVSSRRELMHERVPTILDQSKRISPLSSRYFEREGGSMELINGMTLFSAPVIGPTLDIQVAPFSFTAWVRTSAHFVEGSIVRKRMVPAGPEASLSCWNWKLHHNKGQYLSFGAHDYYPLQAPWVTPTDQEETLCHDEISMTPELDEMLTVVVSGTHVTFYKNLELMASAPLPRPLTDCFNGQEGVLMGSAGLTIGRLRYYPRELTTSTLEELYFGGAMLSEISTGSDPATAQVTPLQASTKQVLNEVAGMRAEMRGAIPDNQINLILMAMEENSLFLSPPPARAPWGDPGDDTQLVDADAGRNYSQLATGPWKLTETTEDADHRYLYNVPDWQGTGTTLTFWYRHLPNCPLNRYEPRCGVYLFAASSSAFGPAPCWTFWIETDGIFGDNVHGTPHTSIYNTSFVEDKYKWNSDKVWRHMAVQFDETSDLVHFFLDGTLAVSVPWNSPVTGADCPNAPDKAIAFGHELPGYTYGQPVEVFDVRQYVHGARGPLSAANIRSISAQRAPAWAAPFKIEDDVSCLPISDDRMADNADWGHTFGHTCQWFLENSAKAPGLCQYEPARLNCPLSCGSRQECFAPPQAAIPHFTWDRLYRIVSPGPNGTICLADDTRKSDVVAECRAWVAAGGPERDAELAFKWKSLVMDRHPGSLRVNLTVCDELETAIDEQCAFNASAVRAFTEEVVANGGDYTISFWMKPLGEYAQIPGTGRFFPFLQMLSSISPPTHNLALAKWTATNGDVRLFSACDRGLKDLFENVEIRESSNDGWTFYAFTRRNAREGGSGSKTTTVTESARFSEDGVMRQCLYNESAFFRALEINYDVVISPIVMIAEALPFAKVQRMYNNHMHSMQVRTGPHLTNKDRVASVIDIHKQDFEPRSALMAPPILFQTRTLPTPQCDSSYANEYIQGQHDKVKESICVSPFLCGEDVLTRPERTVGCRGEAIHNITQFGLSPLEFNGKIGYADFLHSMLSPFLFRDGRVVDTRSFIDSQTESLDIYLVMFSPQHGMTTVLSITAEFAGTEVVDTTVKVEHYAVLEGDDLAVYVTIQILTLVSIVIMLIDILMSCRRLWHRWRADHQILMTDVIKQVTDMGTVAMVIAFVSMRLPEKMKSAPETRRILGHLDNIPWESVEVPLQYKKEEFFESIDELFTLIRTETQSNDFCIVILFVSLLRVIQCTSVHPRLALLTGTLANAADDLWHATLLILMLMGCFAGIGTWRFGSHRDDFESFEAAMQTEFIMFFGEFPEAWQDGWDLQAFVVLYFCICFLFVQNFLLAIVVEAYMNVRQAIIELKTEQEFWTDLYQVIHGHVLGLVKGWPNQGRLGRIISKWDSKRSVGFNDLLGTGLFRSQVAVGSFLLYYRQHKFLEADAISRFAPSTKDTELVDKIERRVAMLMGNPVPTLKEELQRAVESVSIKRAETLRMKGPGGGAEEAARKAWQMVRNDRGFYTSFDSSAGITPLTAPLPSAAPPTLNGAASFHGFFYLPPPKPGGMKGGGMNGQARTAFPGHTLSAPAPPSRRFYIPPSHVMPESILRAASANMKSPPSAIEAEAASVSPSTLVHVPLVAPPQAISNNDASALGPLFPYEEYVPLDPK
eukprot:CAMPEP_0206220982 /NCGR_PEP_ID=MMETSP0047_2-20121206/5167_1 /ASSEMBLY_ACC=CAM_ASM_000192 /TAXON_ID=195065 /ORGANISM="Chroomonas mesostigmatica_cf, Strain CCMP1168" /LENGTH=1725 /DNA_ID=CAMNT_0053643677 /DNA_START=282 /DNA_END=5460 /DNA_ORIENTATION=+